MLKRIGRYINLNPLGAGGMGQVFQAEHELLPGTFVVKLLQPSMEADPEAIERFKRECLIMMRTQPPNIVHCLEPGEENGVWYLPMQFIRGTTLQDRIEGDEKVDWNEKVSWAIQVLSGLEEAHGAGVVHRDLKPSNIMVTDKGIVKIVDFGIAHEAGSGMTRVNPGTREYMAPEQLGNRTIDPRTDLFSLGIVLYLLLAGRHPFKTRKDQPDYETDGAIADPAVSPAPPGDLDPSVPPALGEIVLRALQKDPEKRFASAQEMRLALENLRSATQGSLEDVRLKFVVDLLDRATRLADLGGLESLIEAERFVDEALRLMAGHQPAILLKDQIAGKRSDAERVELLLDKTRHALEAGQLKEARSCLDLALSLRPGDSRLRMLQEELLTRTRERPPVAEGEGALQKKIAEALALAHKGDRAGAHKIFAALLGEAPGDLWVLDAAHAAGVPTGPHRLLVWADDEGGREWPARPAAAGSAPPSKTLLETWDA